MYYDTEQLNLTYSYVQQLHCIFISLFAQKLKLNDFVSPSQIPDLRMTIHYGKKSIALRKTLPGNYHKV